MKYSVLIVVFIALLFPLAALASFPLGMNLPTISYYSHPLLFTDAMKTSSFRSSDWDVVKFDQFPKDSNGYPTEVPFTIEGTPYTYYALFNSLYTGEYALLYDGEGSVTIGGVSSSVIDGVRRFIMPGVATNIWVSVSSVTTGNHVRNIRIIPIAYLNNEGNMPTFNPKYLAGLQPMNAIRTMDITRTNNSIHQEWADRPKTTEATQGGSKGIAWEYLIQLANELGSDLWICIPHLASDDYITQLATLLKNTFNPDRKIYLEFSNEMWNFMFTQSGYISGMAPGHPNSYVTHDLSLLGTIKNVTVSGSTFSGADAPDKERVMFTTTGTMPSPLEEYAGYYVKRIDNNTFQVTETSNGDPIALTTAGSGVVLHRGDNHPVKDAYMMARAFRLFGTVFGTSSDRVVRVATGQHSWPGNTNSILNYLFNTDGIGADALSVAGYFGYDPADHATWVAMDPATVTPEMILQSAANYYPTHEQTWTRQTAAYAKQYGVDYLVYEGGQHMQPYNQGAWAYNHAVWDAQIHPSMYDMYMANFVTHAETEVNCKLFVAYSYVGIRESNYGSWGHLESLDQLDTPETLLTTAPKYKALLDWVAQKKLSLSGSGQIPLSGSGTMTLQ